MLKNKNGSIDELSINVVYSPTTQKGQFGVVIGNLGDLLVLSYGDQILNKELNKLLNEHI